MRKNKIDYVLLLTTLSILVFGLVMVYSASNVVAAYKYDDEFYYFKRQFIFAVISLIIGTFIYIVDINKILKYSKYIFLISIVFLILVLIPGIGVVRGGACRCYTLK